MRRSHSDPEVESYLRKAERDLTTAMHMSKSGVDFADIICFHAEQCAEKALKGFMLALGQLPPRIHDLVVLQQELSRLDARANALQECCLILADYAVAPRYPGWEDLVGTVDIDAVLRAATVVLDYVGNWLDLTEAAGQ